MALIINRECDWIVDKSGIREPQLLRLKKNELLLTFHVDLDRYFAKRACFRSKDQGKTWLKDTPRCYREEAVGKSQDGKKVLAFDMYTFEEKSGVYVGSYYFSDNGGVSFNGPHESKILLDKVNSMSYPETPEQFPEKEHPLNHFYQPLPDYYRSITEKTSHRLGFSFWRYILEYKGKWITTLYGKFHGDVAYRTILVFSEDDGATWRFLSVIGYEHDRTIDGICEAVLQETASGDLLCVARRNKGKSMVQYRSSDGGQTWSVPELLMAHGVAPDLCLMSNGVLACTYGRPGLHIMFSEDGCGYKWNYQTEIGNWRSSAYMGITETEPGRLLLVYDKVKGISDNAFISTENSHIAATYITIEKI